MAAAETDLDRPIPALLGPAPDRPASVRVWRRAAAAILDYRDASGLFDHDNHDPNPARREVGDRPPPSALADHYDEVAALIASTRQTLVLGELASHAPSQPDRLELATEAFATHSLKDLEALRLEASPGDEQQRLAVAIGHREATLRREVLLHPPEWVAQDVTSRLASSDRGLPVAALASTYMESVVQADRAGLDPAVVSVTGQVESAISAVEPTFGPAGLGF